MEFSSFSDPGSRKVNEDYCGTALFKGSSCFVVADGLGGHGGGDVASKAAVETVCSIFAEQGYSEHFFADVFKASQEAILKKQEEAHLLSQMKTTLVILVLHEGKSYYAHVGDSRLYLFTKHKQKMRTIDHSVPQMLALSGSIKESEIRHHPDRNKLMRVLGVKGDDPRYDEGVPVKHSGFQAYLLCTDGFWELIDEEHMVASLKESGSPDEWLSRMASIVSENGKGKEMDNYTAIAVFERTKGLFGL